MRFFSNNNLEASRDHRDVLIHHGKRPVARVEHGDTFHSNTNLMIPNTHVPGGEMITFESWLNQPHPPGVFPHPSRHGHHQVHPVLPHRGVGLQVHQRVVRSEEHGLTLHQRVQRKSFHVKDDLKISSLLSAKERQYD